MNSNNNYKNIKLNDEEFNKISKVIPNNFGCIIEVHLR